MGGQIVSNLLLILEEALIDLQLNSYILFEDIIEFSGTNPTRETQLKILTLIDNFFEEEEDSPKAIEIEKEIKLRLQGVVK